MKRIPRLTARQLANFWAKVDKRGPDECWPWLAYKKQGGYGYLTLRRHGKQNAYLTHRIANKIATGCDPGDLCVCHKCDNPPCCNPRHLFLGTSADNLRDCKAKGRNTRGERNGNAELNTEKVIAIRSAAGTLETIAKRFGISFQHASDIRNGKRWAFIPMPAGYIRRPRAKLTPEQIVEIRTATGTLKTIADRFGVSKGTIGCIRRGVAWKTIPMPAGYKMPRRGRLLPAQVIAIRNATGTLKTIAERFGVSQTHVGAIRRGTYWNHVPMVAA